MSKAVRSTDLAIERWDLISYAAVAKLGNAMYFFDNYELKSYELVSRAVYYAGRFLGGYGENELMQGWACLAVAIQKLDMIPENYHAWVETNQKRQKEIIDKYSRFDLVPYCALRRLAMTCHEGCSKYGESNWLYGFHVKSLLNHTVRHLIKWLNGDTSEDHLGHCCWGFMAPVHMLIYRPDMCDMMLGEAYTLTDEIKNSHPKLDREVMD